MFHQNKIYTNAYQIITFQPKYLAKKLLETFRLFSEQLSVQSHYDFGLRAVKAVLNSTKKLRLLRLEEGDDDEVR